MGAGKSSVGRELARALGWHFRDFDEEVEREEDATVAEVFERHGEEYFRNAEKRVAVRLLALDEVVLASGGGWPTRGSPMQGVPSGTETVWLQVSLEEALRRAEAEPLTRPLLVEKESRKRAGEMLADRAPFYASSKWRVDTEGSTVEDVTARILKILATQTEESGTE